MALKARGIACFTPDYRVSSRQGTDPIDALHSKTLSYLGEFKRSGKSAVEAQLALGGLIEKPKATWKEAAVEVYLALYSLHIDFDLFVSGAIDHGR